jgi:hypothetical protein
MAGNLFVIPYGDKWAIEEENSDVRIVHNTREDALREARKMARENKVDLSIEGENPNTEG